MLSLDENWNSAIASHRLDIDPKVLVILSNYCGNRRKMQAIFSQLPPLHRNCVCGNYQECPAQILASPEVLGSTQSPARGYQINFGQVTVCARVESGIGSWLIMPYPEGMITTTMDRSYRWLRRYGILITWGARWDEIIREAD